MAYAVRAGAGRRRVREKAADDVGGTPVAAGPALSPDAREELARRSAI